MNDAILIQMAYRNQGLEPCLRMVNERHTRYCNQHKMTYQSCVIEPEIPHVGCWEKIELIAEALGVRNNYQYVIWMDVDAWIVDMERDLREACPPDGIGAVVLDRPFIHWNAGVLYFGNGRHVRHFVDNWVPAPKRYPQHEQFALNEYGRELITTLPSEWNMTWKWCRDEVEPVVYALHGCNPVEQRVEMMQMFIDRLEGKT